MTYGYTLTKRDVTNIGLNPTNANEYYIEQNGWSGEFTELYALEMNEYGEFKGELITDKLTYDQQTYIIKNCICSEF